MLGAISMSAAQVCKDMGVRQIKTAARAAAQGPVASVAPGGARAKNSPLCVFVLAHMHDEASLRLRSSAVADVRAPSRARSSKVMQHSVMLHFAGQEPLRWYEDLHPLADKTAPTLATSLRKVLVLVSETVGEVFSPQQFGQRPWMVHILIGDGVPTNEAAAKVLLSWAKAGLPNNLRYLLINIKCSSHQANLAVASAVTGVVALSAALCQAPLAQLAGPSLKAAVEGTPFAGSRICGAIVRLFKFLMSDYFDDFLTSLVEIVGRLEACDTTPELEAKFGAWRGMERLYGSQVFPVGLLDLLNCGFGDWRHRPAASAPGAAVHPAGSAPDAASRAPQAAGPPEVGPRRRSSRASGAAAKAPAAAARAPAAAGGPPAAAAGAPAAAAGAPEATGANAGAHMQDVRDEVQRILRRRLLVVDEKPTLTRMFTFSGHVHGLLLMDLLGCADSLVQLRGNKAHDKARTRMVKVRTFLKSSHLPQYLRRTSLCLELVDHAMSLCSQLPGDGDPVLVRLSKGVVDQKLTEDLVRVLCALHLDPGLDATSAVPALLGTAMDVWLRFSQYQAWPYSVWKLTKKHNPDNYVGACLDFMHMKDDDLDMGFSVPLKSMAIRAGNTDMERLPWLLSDQVQNSLLLVLSASAASSLPIERAFAEVKRSEAPRLCHVATAGRNQVLRQHLRQREDLLKQGSQAAALLRRSARLRLTSLAR